MSEISPSAAALAPLFEFLDLVVSMLELLDARIEKFPTTPEGWGLYHQHLATLRRHAPAATVVLMVQGRETAADARYIIAGLVEACTAARVEWDRSPYQHQLGTHAQIRQRIVDLAFPLCVALERLDLDKNMNAPPVGGPEPAQAQSDSSLPECRHGPDFRSVVWYGTEHVFSSKQAAVVRILWEAWENGTPDVGGATLLTANDCETDRLDHLFNAGRHPAWRTMICPGSSKGTYRLKPPQS
jgi:hypothetical protein